MFQKPRRGRQARNFTTNVPKLLDFKSSSEQIFSENWFRTSVDSIPNDVFLPTWNTASCAKMLASPIPRHEILAFFWILHYISVKTQIAEISSRLCAKQEKVTSKGWFLSVGFSYGRQIVLSYIHYFTSNCFKLQQSIDQFSPLVTDILATLIWFPFKTTYSICGQQKSNIYVVVQFILGLIVFSFVSNSLLYITIPKNKGKWN